MSKQIFFNEQSREKIKRGVDQLSDAVKVTLGARGKNVIIANGFTLPQVTKDGVTVARNISLKDETEDVGAQIVKEAASRTADIAGDGTTTAIVLSQAIITEGMKVIASGVNPSQLKKGIDRAVKEIVKFIGASAKQIGDDFTEIEQVATISSNNDKELGKLIADAFKKIGKDGMITLKESATPETTIEVVGGMNIDRGWISHLMVTDTVKMVSELHNPYILIFDKKISTVKEIQNILKKVITDKSPILIICEDLEQEALAMVVINTMKKSLMACAVKAPSFGENRNEILEDIATITGAKVLSHTRGHNLETIELTDLGRAEKVIISKDNTMIVNGGGDKEKIALRTKQLKDQLDHVKSDYDKRQLQERIGKISGGVAILNVGAVTEVEMKEKKDRIDDALRATKSAIEEGIVIGGGVILLRAIEKLKALTTQSDDESAGIKVIQKMCEAPLRQICINAGDDSSYVVRKVIEAKGNFGYDALTGEYGDMFELGIIDPAKVVRVALENAASVATMILTSDCMLVESPETKQQFLQNQ